MIYAEVRVRIGNVDHGAIYWGVTNEYEALKAFRAEFPKYKDLPATVTLYT